MKRVEILDTAKAAVNGDRDHQYGSPEQSFSKIAQYWSFYLDKPLTASDVAEMMILFKVARGKSKVDNFVDIAGYAACGGELIEDSN